MSDQPVWRKAADIQGNREFVSVRAQIGYRTRLIDPGFREILLSPDATGATLGEAILTAVSASRAIRLEEAMALSAAAREQYEFWVKEISERYGYASRKALFRYMRSCSVDLRPGGLTFVPTNHVRAESWSGLPQAEHVVIAPASTAEEVGAALRLAFSRCVGPA